MIYYSRGTEMVSFEYKACKVCVWHKTCKCTAFFYALDGIATANNIRDATLLLVDREIPLGNGIKALKILQNEYIYWRKKTR